MSDLDEQQRRSRHIVYAKPGLLSNGMNIALHPKFTLGRDIDGNTCSLHSFLRSKKARISCKAARARSPIR